MSGNTGLPKLKSGRRSGGLASSCFASPSSFFYGRGRDNVFAKVFSQIFDSSIAEDYNCRRMFMDLLVLADPTGAVDMTVEAISRRTNVPVEEVVKYVKELSQPDIKSRSKLSEGKRLIPLDSARDWGWQIVNYTHYRKLRDEAARREYFRDKQREHRKRKKKNVKDKVLTPVDGVGQVLTSSSTSSSSLSSSDSEWLEQLCSDETYRGIDVKREHGKMVNWCKTHGVTPSRRRFVNWLNRAEKPMIAPVRGDYPKDWSESKIKEYEESRKKYG